MKKNMTMTTSYNINASHNIIIDRGGNGRSIHDYDIINKQSLDSQAHKNTEFTIQYLISILLVLSLTLLGIKVGVVPLSNNIKNGVLAETNKMGFSKISFRSL